jgi:t-SNARE complex subunit (syntaxin)
MNQFSTILKDQDPSIDLITNNVEIADNNLEESKKTLETTLKAKNFFG